MEDKDIKVLGVLKKEKSSKPFFVLSVFILIIGSCLLFPYVKAYLGDDFNIVDLLNDDKHSISANSTTTTMPTTTTTVATKELLLCTFNGKIYKYSFNNEGNLSKVEYDYTYPLVDLDAYRDNFQKNLSISNSLSELGADSEIVELENSFILKVTINRPGEFSSIDNNLYDLGTLYNVIEDGMKSKGFDCK